MQRIKNKSELGNINYFIKRTTIQNPKRFNLIIKRTHNKSKKRIEEIIKELIGKQLELKSRDVLSEIHGFKLYYVNELKYKLFPTRDSLTGSPINGKKVIYSAKVELYDFMYTPSAIRK